MNQDEFNTRTLRAIQDIHSALLKLTNREYGLRALLLAAAAQPAIDKHKLLTDFEDNLVLLWGQIPPPHQDRAIYETLQAELRTALRL